MPTLPEPAAGARRPSARPRRRSGSGRGRQRTPSRASPRAWSRRGPKGPAAAATGPCCNHEPSRHCRPGGGNAPSCRAAGRCRPTGPGHRYSGLAASALAPVAHLLQRHRLAGPRDPRHLLLPGAEVPAPGTQSGHRVSGAVCRRHEVPRWGRADRGRAGSPGAGTASRGGDDRGWGERPGGRQAFPGVADVGEPVAAGLAAGGREALATKGAGGAKCKLAAAQVAELETVLDAGPAACGYADQCWTLARVADQVWARFGVEYTLAGMDVLLHRLGWSVQVPARRAAERDEDKIARWREETWPVIKGRRRTWAPGWSSRTSPARVSGRRKDAPGAAAAALPS